MSLSASGLLLLADLSTIARRTVITGTSTWFDAFVLAPGLHQQQRCDAFSSSISKRIGAFASEPCTIKNTATGLESKVANEAVLGYLDRVVEGLKKAKAKGGMGPSRCVTLHIGDSKKTPNTPQTLAKSLGLQAARRLYKRLKERGVANTVLAPLLYSIAPILTALSMSFMLATRDWWGVGILCTLILARVLNIWVIRARTKKTQKPGVPDPHCAIVCSLKGHHTTKPPTVPPETVQAAPAPFLPQPDTLEPTQVKNMTFDGRAAVDGSFSAPTGPNTQFPDQNIPQSRPPLEDTAMLTLSAALNEKPLDITIQKLTEVLPNLDRATIPTQYLLNLPGASTPIKIQGRASDMEILLSGSWMREKTNVEGYMEAIAKVLVYGVAAVSGNMKQTGTIILGGLLVVSAAALALVNSTKAGDTKEWFGGKVKRVDDEWDLDGDGVKDVDFYDEKDELMGREKRAEGSAV